MAKIIKYGKRLLTTDKREKFFICTCCDCRWIAVPSEYVTIRTPMKPNTYCWCPNCGNQTWEHDYED
ncbi:hypothetical protein [Ruminococcus sp.]|uniref:hypothetical protein n=1 Tax=Ruminococcus sp. TaxID=41978 RepID=UPI0025EEFF2C|nr:hypothetical protein [Ruminococcus sp.]